MKLTSTITLPVLAFAALLGAPAGATADILLSAGAFTVLGGSAITNTGASDILNGNVGLSPTAAAAITGFNPPGVITGGAIIETGLVTAQARADVITAATGLAGMPFDEDLSALNLGGMILAPGVYKFSATAGLTGTLTLDAQGQNHAYWVFQIGSTLTTAVGAAVTLINPGSNGGGDNGIFWVAGTTMTFGTSNQILGNYLAGTSITSGAATGGSGRFLALSAVTLDSTGIDAHGGPGGGDWTGGLVYGPGDTVIAGVPEPAAWLWLAPLGALALVLARRRARRHSRERSA